MEKRRSYVWIDAATKKRTRVYYDIDDIPTHYIPKAKPGPKGPKMRMMKFGKGNNGR